MSISTHITAFRDMDGEFARMLEAKKFCDERKLSYPKEVDEYFHDMAGESEELLREEFLTIDIKDIATKYESFGQEGYEVEIARLPVEVKTIRFYASW